MKYINRITKYIFNSKLYQFWIEYRIKCNEQKRFIANAKANMGKAILPLHDTSKILYSYVKDMKRYMVDFDEWNNMYDFKNLTCEEKSTYISRSNAQKLYRKIIKPEWRDLFNNKEKFLIEFSRYIHRFYYKVTDDSKYENISDIISKYSVIVKPINGSLGNGIYKITPSYTNLEKDIIISRILKEKPLIEECISGCEELQLFHPNSLNTIRIVTINNGVSNSVLGAFFRMGRGGNIIDNAHAGGIFAPIDIKSGKIDAPGMDTFGNRYEHHPDSKKTIIGFQIPYWEQIMKLCIEAHDKCPNFIVGWDVVINKNNDIEFIEANHAPDKDVMQGPRRIGIRNEFELAYNGFINKKTYV